MKKDKWIVEDWLQPATTSQPAGLPDAGRRR